MNSNNSGFTGLFLRTSSSLPEPPPPSVSGVPQGLLKFVVIKSALATSSTTFCVHQREQCPTSGPRPSAGYFSLGQGLLQLFHSFPRRSRVFVGSKLHSATELSHPCGAERSTLLSVAFYQKLLPSTSLVKLHFNLQSSLLSLGVAGGPLESSTRPSNTVLH